MKHTPGPWKRRSDLPYTSHGVVVFHGHGEENRTICRLREGTQEERDANSCLIAAAPELLEALEKIRNLERRNFREAWDMLQEVDRIAAAALRNAEAGRQDTSND